VTYGIGRHPQGLASKQVVRGLGWCSAFRVPREASRGWRRPGPARLRRLTAIWGGFLGVRNVADNACMRGISI